MQKYWKQNGLMWCQYFWKTYQSIWHEYVWDKSHVTEVIGGFHLQDSALSSGETLGIHLILINLSHPVEDSLAWAVTDSHVSTFNMKIALEQHGEALGFKF